jgi:hypothetical protein
VIVHSATGFVLRFLLGAVIDAHGRGVLTPERTPKLWAQVEAILAWCSAPGDDTR